MKIKNKKLFTKRKIAISLIIIIFLALAGFWYYYQSTQKLQKTGPGGINLKPPTETDKRRSEDHKKEIDKEQADRKQSSGSSPEKTAVTPVITYAGLYDSRIEVGAYIASVYEDGGTCELALTKGSASVNTAVIGVKDAGKVNCPVMVVEKNKLSSGTWQATVTYTSSMAMGTSSVKSIEVK